MYVKKMYAKFQKDIEPLSLLKLMSNHCMCKWDLEIQQNCLENKQGGRGKIK